MAATPVTLGPANGSIKVRTYREGMASRAGHDLVFEARNWTATATVDRDNPAASSVEATIDLRSLEITEATGGVKPLSDGDRKDVRKNLEKTLSIDRYPEVKFQSKSVMPNADSQLHLNGDLSLAGTTRPVSFDVAVQPEGDGEHVTGRVTLTHSDFGVKPYSGFLGALKIKDAVEIDLDVRVPRS